MTQNLFSSNLSVLIPHKLLHFFYTLIRAVCLMLTFKHFFSSHGSTITFKWVNLKALSPEGENSKFNPSQNISTWLRSTSVGVIQIWIWDSWTPSYLILSWILTHTHILLFLSILSLIYTLSLKRTITFQLVILHLVYCSVVFKYKCAWESSKEYLQEYQK